MIGIQSGFGSFLKGTSNIAPIGRTEVELTLVVPSDIEYAYATRLVCF